MLASAPSPNAEMPRGRQRESRDERRHRVEVALQIRRQRVDDAVDTFCRWRRCPVVRRCRATRWAAPCGLHLHAGDLCDERRELDVDDRGRYRSRDRHALPERLSSERADVEDVFAGGIR